MFKFIQYLLVFAAISLIAGLANPAAAFEQLPRSLAWELIDMSGEKVHASNSMYGIYRVQKGQTVDMWVTVKNLSKNPRAEVWYGRDSLLPEGPLYPNAHAIGVGTLNPMDNKPGWVDPASFVINGNRLTYYNGAPVSWGQTVTLNWKIKLADNVADGIYNLNLGLVREFDEWGERVTSTGAHHQFQDVYWKFAVGNVVIPQNPSEYFTSNVATSVGTFATKQVKIDLANPYLKIITDTAVTSDTVPAPWPVYSMSEFLGFNNADIGINGSYFWPAEYGGDPAKANTFNPMVYNSRLGVMINEKRNAGNLGGLIVFDDKNKPYFFLKTNEFKSKVWFEITYKTKLQAALANVSTLVYDGAINYGNGDLDEKMLTVRSSRAAIGIKDGEARLVVVSNATVPHLAAVMQSLGMKYALNLDGGGSTALYYQGGFKAGPGRKLANVILFKTR